MNSTPGSNAAEVLRTKRGEIAEHIESLKSDANRIRARIDELNQRRNKILDTHISKEEYLNLSLAWIDYFADAAAERAAIEFSDPRRGVISEKNQHITKMGRFLSDGRAPSNPLGVIVSDKGHGISAIEPGFLVLFLREQIKEVVRTKIMENVDWPYENTINDVAATRQEIFAIGVELKNLNTELVALVDLGKSFGATI